MNPSLLEELHAIQESIGDNTIDNLVDELARATAIEMEMYANDLLSKMVQGFARDYSMPFYDEFKSSFRLLLSRYQLMSGDEEGDLFRKIEHMFMNIFSSKFSSQGYEVADVIAKKYATQMIRFLKHNKIQANSNLDLDKTKVYY